MGGIGDETPPAPGFLATVGVIFSEEMFRLCSIVENTDWRQLGIKV